MRWIGEAVEGFDCLVEQVRSGEVALEREKESAVGRLEQGGGVRHGVNNLVEFEHIAYIVGVLLGQRDSDGFGGVHPGGLVRRPARLRAPRDAAVNRMSVFCSSLE